MIFLLSSLSLCSVWELCIVNDEEMLIMSNLLAASSQRWANLCLRRLSLTPPLSGLLHSTRSLRLYQDRSVKSGGKSGNENRFQTKVKILIDSRALGRKLFKPLHSFLHKFREHFRVPTRHLHRVGIKIRSNKLAKRRRRVKRQDWKIRESSFFMGFPLPQWCAGVENTFSFFSLFLFPTSYELAAAHTAKSRAANFSFHPNRQ